MFKRDIKGKFIYHEVGIFNKKILYRFYSGKITTQKELEEKDYRILLENQKSEPIGIMHDPASRKRWWMFRNDFYCEDEGYTAAAIKVLILDRIEQLEKKVSRAQARLTHNTISSSTLREPIPDDVKMFVWRRDGGKCVRCGNVVNLEYDHIIPIAKGGSNTARNIQLLCEKCNREKGANLFYRC